MLFNWQMALINDLPNAFKGVHPFPLKIWREIAGPKNQTYPSAF